MKVIAKIQARADENTSRPSPVTLTYYNGDNMVSLLHAVTSCLTTHDDNRFVELLSITIDLED